MNRNLPVLCVDIMLKNEKKNLQNSNEQKINFPNREKYAQHKILCICIDVCKTYEDNNNEIMFEVSSSLKNNF